MIWRGWVIFAVLFCGRDESIHIYFKQARCEASAKSCDTYRQTPRIRNWWMKSWIYNVNHLQVSQLMESGGVQHVENVEIVWCLLHWQPHDKWQPDMQTWCGVLIWMITGSVESSWPHITLAYHEVFKTCSSPTACTRDTLHGAFLSVMVHIYVLAETEGNM